MYGYMSPVPGALGAVPAAPQQYVPTGMGGLANIEEVSATIGGAVAVGGMLGAGLYGGLIGGMASANWKGAATGAIAGAGLYGIGAGGLVASAGGTVGGSVIALTGLGLTGWGIYRWNKKRKGR